MSMVGFGLLAVLSGCGEEKSERETYEELAGIYRLSGAESYAGVCDQRQKPTKLRPSEYLIAYVVERGVPEVQLHLEGCGSLESCRGLAIEVKTHGARIRRSGYLFRHLAYSRVRSGRVDGVQLVGSTEPDGTCALDLRVFSLWETDSGVDFGITTREGVRYPPTNQECIHPSGFEAEWRDWQDNPCLEYEVLHGKFAEPLSASVE
jgi:hypothetical protein